MNKINLFSIELITKEIKDREELLEYATFPYSRDLTSIIDLLKELRKEIIFEMTGQRNVGEPIEINLEFDWEPQTPEGRMMQIMCKQWAKEMNTKEKLENWLKEIQC